MWRGGGEQLPINRKKQCTVLLELLKKFQTCRNHLSTTIQKAEQTISDQASYMGKDNLQRSIAKDEIHTNEENINHFHKKSTEIQEMLLSQEAPLELQEEHTESVLKEVGLVSSVASPQVVEQLSADCSRLKEAIIHTKDMIHLKREEGVKGLYRVINGQWLNRWKALR
ncbi:hypothetical protein GOODEAATRI_006647 [Goodea atripinnis]|uniref:Uncharacterized protein n=1 Tax=Goodea atripinnis TaxID=208336 RepID=A0ABV0P4V7_9TELE